MSNFLETPKPSVSASLESVGIGSNSIQAQSTNEHARLDLTVIQADKSLSLHQLLKTRIAHDSVMAIITVIDLDQVNISKEAAACVERCYLTPAYLLDRFGNHYKKCVVAEITRGNLKGMKYINAEANEYVLPTETGIEIVVTGKCVDLDNRKTRQTHITCRHQHSIAVSESVVQ
jgi:hypothetical protein